MGLSFRVTIAALFEPSLFHSVFKCSLPLWTVLTAVILTQVTFGRSLKATIDYLVGTLFGAIYAAPSPRWCSHANEITLAGVLAITVAPFSARSDPIHLQVATFTGVLVLLVPGITRGPNRMASKPRVEVAIGGITPISGVLLVLPARAHALAIEAAARCSIYGGFLPQCSRASSNWRCNGDWAHP